MSLEICCDNCGQRFIVVGYTTADSFTEPGEVVTDLELLDDDEQLCECLEQGGQFWVVNEDHETFPDDVI